MHKYTIFNPKDKLSERYYDDNETNTTPIYIKERLRFAKILKEKQDEIERERKDDEDKPTNTSD